MAEIIYTHIKPNIDYVYKTYSKSYLKDNVRTSSQYKKLSDNINNNGILYPIVAPSNNQVIGKLSVGNQRMSISLDLNINKIPAILYSIHYKTGFEGFPISGLDDIIEIFGEGIKNEPVYGVVETKIIEIRRRNNYPPDPLKIKTQLDD